MTTICITTLVENTASGRGVRGEHGLAFWIEAGPHHVLFDTGQTADVLLHNADRLKIYLAAADTVVLSHGHYDHTGGLDEVLRQTSRPRLLLHPAALSRRFIRRLDGSVPDIGIPAGLTEADLRQRTELVWTAQPTDAVAGLKVTGEVPRNTDYEDTGGAFYLNSACTWPDPITDDQAVFFDTSEGTVVLLGCAHAGVINTLHYVQRLTDGQPIRAVIGGMHLAHASPERMDRTVQALRQLDVGLIAPTHCTGARSAARLWAELPDRWQPCPVGTRFEFQRADKP